MNARDVTPLRPSRRIVDRLRRVGLRVELRWVRGFVVPVLVLGSKERR